MADWKPYPIVGGAYSDDTKPWTAQDTVNYLPVRVERAGGRSNELLRSAPGGSLFAVLGDGPIRGARDVEGKLLVVSGRSLYQVFSDSSWNEIGTIPGVGRVQMTHNQIAGGNQVVIGNGISGYVYNTYTETLEQITDEAFPGFGSVDFIAGFVAGVEPQGRYWFHSNLADALDYSSLDRYESEISPDLIVGLIETHGEVMVLSQKTCEFYANTGAATGTFQRQNGTSLEVGCASRHSIAKIDNSIIWLGNDGIVYRLNGYSALPISTGPMSQAISRCDMSKAFATVFDSRGHKIYYLTFPDGQTWGYDVTTQEWARRESYGLARWRYNTLTRWNGVWIGGDYNSGNLLQLRWGYMREGDNPVVRSRTCGVLHDNQNPLTVNGFELVMDTGNPALTFPVEDPLPRPALAISGDVPDGYVGEAISYQYATTGGVPAYGDYTITAGALPDGLSMSATGLVTGTYTEQGSFGPWTVSRTDAAGNAATLVDSAEVLLRSWLLGYTGGGSVKSSPDGEDWSAADVASGGGSTVAFARDGQSVLRMSSNVNGARFSADAGQTWAAVTHTTSAAAGSPLFAGGYWHVADSTNKAQRSATGLAFAAVPGAPASSAIVSTGTRLVSAAWAGGAFIVIHHADIAGAAWTTATPVPIAYAALTVGGMDFGAGVIGMISRQTGAFGGTATTDARAHIHASTDGGDTFTEVTNPFPDRIDPAALYLPRIHYDATLALWVAVFLDRIAYGPTLGALTLSAHVLPQLATGIDSDGTKFIVCGNGGMLQKSTDGNAWTALTSGVTTTIGDVAFAPRAA